MSMCLRICMLRCASVEGKSCCLFAVSLCCKADKAQQQRQATLSADGPSHQDVTDSERPLSRRFGIIAETY